MNMNGCSLQTIKKYTVKVYEYICWVLTACLVGYSISVYIQDHDITRTSNVKFHSSPKDIYPSISLCFGDILDKKKLEAQGINKTLYSRFLTGEHWNKSYLDVDFGDVSIDLEKYLLAIAIYKEGYNVDVVQENSFLFDNTMLQAEKQEDGPTWRPNFYSDAKPFSGLIQKCMSFDIPIHTKQTFTWMIIAMSKSVFRNGKRPATYGYEKEFFSVDIHYPRQRYRYAQMKTEWPTEEPQDKFVKSYGMGFRINDMEVMDQRNTRRTPCIENSIEDDPALKAALIGVMNCTPPYWIQAHDIIGSKCSAQEEIRKFYMFDIGTYAFPCRRLNHINFDYSEYPDAYIDNRLNTKSLKCRRKHPGSLIRNVSLDSFYVGLMFRRETYKETSLTRQFDMQSLIGNAGGYVGMCVGYSLSQLPQLIVNIFSTVQKIRQYQERG